MNIESLITDGWTTDRLACEEAAEALSKSDPDWTYEVVFNGHNDLFERMYCIRITDEDGYHIRDAYPRQMSRFSATKIREEKKREEKKQEADACNEQWRKTDGE